MAKPKGGETIVKTTIYLDGATRKQLRIRAIEEGISATKLVERLIRDYLKQRHKGR